MAGLYGAPSPRIAAVRCTIASQPLSSGPVRTATIVKNTGVRPCHDGSRGQLPLLRTSPAHTFANLGMSPLCQTHITAAQLNEMERFYPLHAYVCEHCFLVQLEEFVAPPEIFNEYAYFSSFAESWVAHARDYCDLMRTRFGTDQAQPGRRDRKQRWLSAAALVARGVTVLGVEPAANVASSGGARYPVARQVLRHPDARASWCASSASPTCCWAITSWRTFPPSTILSPV
jgi:hypothetical protein